MKRIVDAAELAGVARQLGVRTDWHEPGEQNVSAYAAGTHLDNAMPPATWYPRIRPPHDCEPHAELYVMISQQKDGNYEPVAIAAVLVADLLAWACAYGRSLTSATQPEEQ